MGGEDDIRGFDILTISPIAYIPTDTTIGLSNPDGSPKVQRIVNADGSISTQAVTQTIPVYQLILPGGDTATVFNYEYRIPLIGPITLAPFLDAGEDRLTLPSQLGLNPLRVEELHGRIPASHHQPARGDCSWDAKAAHFDWNRAASTNAGRRTHRFACTGRTI